MDKRKIGRMIVPGEWNPNDYYEVKPVTSQLPSGVVKIIREAHERVDSNGEESRLPVFRVRYITTGIRATVRMMELIMWWPAPSGRQKETLP